MDCDACAGLGFIASPYGQNISKKSLLLLHKIAFAA
jgi:hypothetical protein